MENKIDYYCIVTAASHSVGPWGEDDVDYYEKELTSSSLEGIRQQLKDWFGYNLKTKENKIYKRVVIELESANQIILDEEKHESDIKWETEHNEEYF